jgi:hypothetical protein
MTKNTPDPFAAAQAAGLVPKCEMCRTAAGLDPVRRQQFIDAITGVTLVEGVPVAAPTIVSVVRSWGLQIGATAIRQHRRDFAAGTPCRGWANVVA